MIKDIESEVAQQRQKCIREKRGQEARYLRIKALCHERFPLCKTREREQKTPDHSSGKSLKP